MHNEDIASEADIFTVSQLNAEARAIIEEYFHNIWVVGEISNIARPSSGHIYFTLKDKYSQVRCALFRNQARQVNFSLDNGQQILIQSRCQSL